MKVLVFTPVLRKRWFDLSSKAMYAMLPLEDEGQVDYLQLVGGDTAATRMTTLPGSVTRPGGLP